MKLPTLIMIASVLAPGAASGAEYHVYKDAGGQTILSNLPLTERPADRAPESLTLVKRYELSEASQEEIAATEKHNLEAIRTNAIRDLAAQAERLADEMQRSNDIVLEALRLHVLRPTTEINQVNVATLGRSHFRTRR